MTATTRIFFDVGTLLVRGELLGTSVVLPASQRTFTLKIPATDDEFVFSDAAAWRIHAFGHSSGGVGEGLTELYTSTRFGPMVMTEQTNVCSVAVLALDVILPEAQALEAVDQATSLPKEFSKYQAAVDSAVLSGTRLMGELIAWLRVETGQFWLPASESKIVPLRPVVLLAEDGGVRHDAMCRTRGALVILSPDEALRRDQLQKVTQDLEASEFAPEPEQLIRDAQYFSTFGSDRDCARATLFAAMACETKIKVALKTEANGTNALLIELILGGRGMPIDSLFDLPAKAVFGTSLQAADKGLYKRIAKLFAGRNRFVHGLSVPNREDAIAHVLTAKEACEWIESCATPGAYLNGTSTESA